MVSGVQMNAMNIGITFLRLLCVDLNVADSNDSPAGIPQRLPSGFVIEVSNENVLFTGGMYPQAQYE